MKLIKPTPSLTCVVKANGCYEAIAPRTQPLCDAWAPTHCRPLPKDRPGDLADCTGASMLLILGAFALLAWIRHDASPASLARKEAARQRLKSTKHKKYRDRRHWGDHY